MNELERLPKWNEPDTLERHLLARELRQGVGVIEDVRALENSIKEKPQCTLPPSSTTPSPQT